MAEETAGALNLALSTAFLLSQTVGEFTTTQTLLEPLANVLRCQLPVVKRLVENIKVYEKYYNADHFINSLLVYQETLKGIRILLEKLNDQSFWIQIWSSKQNKLEMDILIKSFQLASNSLQLGFQIDDLGKVMDEKFKDYKISNNDRSNDQLRQLSAVNKDFEKKFQRYQESVTASRANYNSSSRSPRFNCFILSFIEMII
ncbi:hypothetical protein BC833DRAFT_323499 [Globomyces pollinis-pini]|nr:hypothetical protein BC833DRAFT_323499 [Globomyces pollinis-pini]